MLAYQRVSDDCSSPVVVDEALVAGLLEERHRFRMQQRWPEADAIFQRLVAMGVLIDDKQCSWKLGEAPKELKSVSCELCHRRFRSRNRLFKHLRAPGPCSLNELDSLVDSKPESAQISSRPFTEAQLWLGLPSRMRCRLLKELLYRHTPKEVEPACIKKMVRRGRGSYAILCYRDLEEVQMAQQALDGLSVDASGFVLRARAMVPAIETPSFQDAKELGRGRPRRIDGHPLPEGVARSLLEELTVLRWPRHQRRAVSSEKYLVLHRNSKFPKLEELCGELMSWADPQFSYSAVAVTKNFVASPHVDEQDKSFQYAVALGDFQGGELCVQEETSSFAVVNTRNRIAKIDGRYLHWVRSYSGERYSLIFYNTCERQLGKGELPLRFAMLLLAIIILLLPFRLITTNCYYYLSLLWLF